MKELIGRLMTELQAIYQNEEIIVCFIEDLMKQNNEEVNKLLKWYRLTVTKGSNFSELYANVQKRMKTLEEQDKQNADKQFGKPIEKPENTVGQTFEQGKPAEPNN